MEIMKLIIYKKKKMNLLINLFNMNKLKRI